MSKLSLLCNCVLCDLPAIWLHIHSRAAILRKNRTVSLEGWPSGLRRTPGKRVGVKAPRGFESPSLRHTPLLYVTFYQLLCPIIPCFLGIYGHKSYGPVYYGAVASKSKWGLNYFLGWRNLSRPCAENQGLIRTLCNVVAFRSEGQFLVENNATDPREYES